MDRICEKINTIMHDNYMCMIWKNKFNFNCYINYCLEIINTKRENERKSQNYLWI